jgi:periplasmic protein TonB
VTSPAMKLRSTLGIGPALLGALLINAALFGLLGLLSRERGRPQDISAPTGIRLVTLPAPQPREIEEIKTRPRPTTTKPETFKPDLRPPSLAFTGPAFDGDIVIDLGAMNTGPIEQPLIFNAAELDQAPQTLVRVPPIYPFKARERGVEGVVQVKLLVNMDGTVGDVQILDATPAGIFEDAVQKTVPRWKFKPGRLDGQAVNAWIITSVRFDLD